ncbi:M23 family metallopeptidase [Halovenus sp. HT40]|uniref:M23 family metallopeptidase n=1 Tax=Halovenus sp. HT40 TaxID=3126691 RepID=UPI00300EFC7F
MTNQTAGLDWRTRLRRWLRRADPARLWLLGLLALPGYVVDSLEFLQVFSLFFLALFWVLLEPVVDAALARDEETTAPTDWIGMGDRRELAVFYGMLPFTFVNPLMLVQDSFQFLGSAVAAVRHRGSLPARGDERTVDYRLPVDGEWTVVNGSLDREFSHSWFPVNQRYAYDFVIADEDGRTRPEGSSPAVENYYCHDEPVLAPADGVVVDVFETDLEPGRGGGVSHPLKRDIRGNYVTIQHAPGEFSCLAHLVPGSVAVEPGESVDRGQEIGRCGHTGNSSEPHLHFQLQDSPTFEMSAGLPVEFAGVETESPWLDDSGSGTESTQESEASAAIADGGESTAATGDKTAVTAGQRVRQDKRVDETGGEQFETPKRRAVGTLERTALGFGVGILAAVFGGFLVDQPALSLAIGGCALAGLGSWALLNRVRTARPGSLGVPVGLAVAAALWWVGSPVSAVVLVLAASLGYAAVAEIDRLRCRRGFGIADHRTS